jgi:hypothetical protein
VFRVAPGGRFPALHGASNCPGTGPCSAGHRTPEQRATTVADRIRQCWTHADYNIGIATGPAGLVVVDLDVAKPGKPVPPKWAEQGAECGMDVFLIVCADAGQEPPLETFTVATHSGGTHLYFTAPDAIELRNTQGERGNGLGWGIDTRAHGGYVIGPGSIRPGGRYRITHDTAPMPLPGWLAERLTPAELPPEEPRQVSTESRHRGRYVDAAIRGELDRITHAPAGERNFALYCAATALGQLVAGGALTEDEVTAVLTNAASAHVAARAYGWNQAHRTIASGLRAGAKRPRKVSA